MHVRVNHEKGYIVDQSITYEDVKVVAEQFLWNPRESWLVTYLESRSGLQSQTTLCLN